MKTSVIEADWLDLPEEELRTIALDLFENQRRIRELRKTDLVLLDAQEHAHLHYTEPAKNIEVKLKIIRRIFKLRNMEFKEAK